MYCTDYDDYMPSPFYYTTPLGSYWPAAFVYFAYTPPPKATSSPLGVHVCPSEPRITLGPSTAWNSWKGSHYGMNRYLSQKFHTNATSTTYLVWRLLSSAKFPSYTYVIGDKGGNPATISFHGELRGRYLYPALRHDGKWNVSMIDGHAESQTEYPFMGVATDYPHKAWAPMQW